MAVNNNDIILTISPRHNGVIGRLEKETSVATHPTPKLATIINVP